MAFGVGYVGSVFLQQNFLMKNIVLLVVRYFYCADVVHTYVGVTLDHRQDCLTVYFQNRAPSFGTFWKPLEWKILTSLHDHLVYFDDICFILWQFGLSCGLLLYIISPFCYICKIWPS
jgi:hypothetical protein